MHLMANSNKKDKKFSKNESKDEEILEEIDLDCKVTNRNRINFNNHNSTEEIIQISQNRLSKFLHKFNVKNSKSRTGEKKKKFSLFKKKCLFNAEIWKENKFFECCVCGHNFNSALNLIKSDNQKAKEFWLSKDLCDFFIIQNEGNRAISIWVKGKSKICIGCFARSSLAE